MNICIVNNTRIPPPAYGGAERIIWWLGKALARRGHQVTYLVKADSTCDFAKVLVWDEKIALAAQIPPDTDLVHLHIQTAEELPYPTLFTCHENVEQATVFHPNTVFLSANHARRHGGRIYVHNGLDFEDYGEPVLDNKRMYFHFLGKAAWRVKNVRGAIDIAGQAQQRLHVIGGSRVNFRRGLQITLSPHVRFHGLLAGEGKNILLNGSKGLIFPTLWHEPFGLAVVESLYFGCPVFGTPYGALPELLGSIAESKPESIGRVDAFYSDYGFLSTKKNEIIEAIKNADSYDRERCHAYAVARFSVDRMTDDYLRLYQQVIAGQYLHDSAPTVADTPDDKLLPLT